jgi:hypothetical protein
VTSHTDFSLDDGANSVGANNDVCLCRSAVRERKMDTIGFFAELDTTMTESNRPFWQSIEQ